MANAIKGDDYEIIPHQILSDLRDEIETVKQRLKTPVGEMERELLGSIAELKHSMDQMNSLIKSAAEEVKKEEKGGVTVQLKRLNTKIDEVSQQNAQIASALLSVANMVQNNIRKGVPSRPAPPRPMPPSRPMAPPSEHMAPPTMPPRPMAPPPGPIPSGPSIGGVDMPPPPPGMEPGAEFEKKKKGLLSMLFKK